jgi:phosphatidylglycerophosphate synthase
LSLAGIACAFGAAAVLLVHPASAGWSAILVLLAWFFDRADGQLARRQQTATPLGAWLDGNLDELADVGLHIAVAAAAMATGAVWAWPCLIAFLAGKYLLMHGLLTEPRFDAPLLVVPPSGGQNTAAPAPTACRHKQLIAAARALYHLPGNADVRVHVLALALVTGWLTSELAFVAIYYNLRWMVRYILVVRKHKDAA